MSSEKISQYKKIEQTQNKFMHLTQTLKDSMKVSQKGNGSFDIGKYMMSMAKYTRTRDAF